MFPPGVNKVLNYVFPTPVSRNQFGTLDYYDGPLLMENAFWNSAVSKHSIVQGVYVVVRFDFFNINATLN